MNQLGTVYATKRRRRNGKSLKPPPKDGVTKSNPSKRHRERLNAELDTLASLLPFEQNILSKLDRLSILRLSVSYLRTKSYFQVSMQKDQEERLHHDAQFRNREITSYEHSLMDGEMFLQALNGFLLMLTCEGEVFFATHSIESYLGFHQSDIVHQSVYELVHSEDREELQRQLIWNSFLPPESANITLQEVLQPNNCHLLERSFTVRFRCLLDNTSGFLRLDIRGRIKVLHGQNRKTEDPPLALFALCTPFGPPSLLEIPQKEVMFKSKHKLDLSLVSMDQRGKMLLGYSDAELANMGGYDLVHYDDLAYVASAHQELLKTGASGMIAYRMQTKESQWQWLQTSSRLVYKNSKPDFIISTHRPLMEEEGRDLLGKRTMDFKVSYLDAGLTNSYFADSEAAAPSQRMNRRYKTQLRDFLSTCRTKRKLGSEYLNDPGYAAAANFNNVYATAAAAAAYPPDNGLYSMQQNLQNFQNLYPTIDNRFLSTDNLFQTYRPLGTYYTDYATAAAAAHHSPYSNLGNGFLDVSPRTTCPLPTYDTAAAAAAAAAAAQLTSATKTPENKLYPCQLDPTGVASPGGGTGAKVYSNDRGKLGSCADYMVGVSCDKKMEMVQQQQQQHPHQQHQQHQQQQQQHHQQQQQQHQQHMQHQQHQQHLQHHHQQQQQQHHHQAANGLTKVEDHHHHHQSMYASNDTRQTVLMWGSGRSGSGGSGGNGSPSPTPPNANSLHHVSYVDSGGGGGGGGSSGSPGTPTTAAAAIITSSSNGNSNSNSSTNGNSNGNSASTATTTNNNSKSHNSKGSGGGGGGGGGGAVTVVTTPNTSSYGDPLKSLVEMNSLTSSSSSAAVAAAVAACKWDPSSVTLAKPISSPNATSTSPNKSSGYVPYSENGSEVWHHQYYSYPPYHHTPHSATDSYYPSINRSGVLCCPSLK